MRAPRRRRPNMRRTFVPGDVDLESVAARATYIGSRDHKNIPSYAGPPGLRADASCCPLELSKDLSRVVSWLRDGIRQGLTGGPWEGQSLRFPRYVWYQDGTTVYEGRLVNRELGQYKGYPLERSEWPSAFEGIDAES